MQAREMMLQVSDETFDSVLATVKTPVVFIMGASWCPDCQRIAPFMKNMMGDYVGKLTFLQADFDTAQKLKERFEIRHIPAFILLKDGQVADSLIEPKSIAPVKAFLDRAIA